MVVSGLLLTLLLLRALAGAAYSLPFMEDLGGSGEAEGSSASSPSLPLARTPALSPTPLGPQPTVLAGPRPPTNLLDGIKDFFRQYVMLIAVVGSLVFLMMFIVCAALVTRQKHKASAYYPSSFPKRKYVDQSDRAGGPQAFCEVPDKAPASRPEEALDSSQQLQADILAATQNLKSPARAGAGSGDAARGEARAQEGASAEPGSAGPEAGEGPGEPEAVPLLAQEAGGVAGPPEGPCVSSTVPPSA
ncbi:transmembrane protein 119 [Sorex fumeus]|uniref:transmembrane protein 119 n=1 Tax=Sorex fumeus TaxID=62283 RepID=UPI0024AD957B|nr:transmembrane protein 119 [Sorex fumeus]